MKNRLSWLAFPAAAFMGAVLCFLRNSGEPTSTSVANNPSPHPAAVLIEREAPAAVEDSAPIADTEVMQALRSALLHSSALHRRYELARIAEQVGEQELPHLLEQCLKEPNAIGAARHSLAEPLLELWAERAPESAAAFVAKYSGGYQLSQTVARGWGRRDPGAALKWVMSLPPEKQLDHLAELQEGSFESGKPNPVEVMQAALQSYDAAPQPAQRASITRMIDQWARNDASAAEAFARGMANEQQRNLALIAVVSALTETTPQKAIDVFEKISVSPQWRFLPAADLAAQLAAQDEALATQFAQAQPEGQARAAAMASVATVMLDGDPEKARALIESIPVADSLDLSSFYREWTKTDPAAAFAHSIQRLERMDPSSEAYDRFQSSITFDLKKESPVRETAEFLSGNVKAEWQSRLSDVVQRWMGQDSVGAAAWAEALPGGSAREHALAGVARGKTTQSVGETVEWLATLPKGPDYSAAVQGFASSVFSKDPDGALAWLKTISDPAERQRHLLAAWKQWAATSSLKTAAEQWRDSSPDLTPEERKVLVLPEAR